MSTEFLSKAETEEMLDALARKKMGISIKEYRKNRDAGAYKNINRDSIPGLVEVAMLAG